MGRKPQTNKCFVVRFNLVEIGKVVLEDVLKLSMYFHCVAVILGKFCEQIPLTQGPFVSRLFNITNYHGIIFHTMAILAGTLCKIDHI